MEALKGRFYPMMHASKFVRHGIRTRVVVGAELGGAAGFGPRRGRRWIGYRI